MIKFNIPPTVGNEVAYIKRAIQNNKISGDGQFTKQCSEWFENQTNVESVLLTTSCTHALELAAILLDIKEGDEVIMPSYTFVSTADAFAMRGAQIVFVDIRPDTMNIDETKIEAAITNKTVAIVPVHYAGVACEMDKICKIADQYKLKIVEDAAQGVKSYYKGKSLGSIGEFGCYSFHETKNYSMGEGGALLIRDKAYLQRAEIVREKGTNRSQFFRGEIDKYTWVELGSSYLPSELNAAYLWGQLEKEEQIFNARMKCWNKYYEQLKELEKSGKIELPFIPKECSHNAHMFYIKTKNLDERTNLIRFLKDKEVAAVFHYVPLHSAPAGLKWGRFQGEDEYTTIESERLLRLPLYYGLKEEEVIQVTNAVKKFYED